MLVRPLLSQKASCCLWVRLSPELLRVWAGAAGSRGGIIHHPNSTETAVMVIVHTCAQLGILYEGSSRTTTHCGKVAKGAGACGGGGGMFVGVNWTCRARGEVGNGAL